MPNVKTVKISEYAVEIASPLHSKQLEDIKIALDIAYAQGKKDTLHQELQKRMQEAHDLGVRMTKETFLHNTSDEEYNIIDGEKCCWRCGASQNDVNKDRSGGCSNWGTYYGNHMYKATNLAKFTLNNLLDDNK